MAVRNSIVVVSGASAGLGRAIAVAFARRGCRIGLIARDRHRLNAAANEVRAAGGHALTLPLDVADADAVEDAAARVEDEFGPMDIWINSAMATVYSPFARMKADEFRRVTEVTYLGTVHGTLAALKRMRQRDRGTIIQIGSSLAYRSIPLQSAYCGAKAAIRGFTDSLRSELIHDDSAIRLSMVQMPAINTPQFDWARNHMTKRPRPVAPILQPEPMAEAVVRAAETAPRELWVDPSTVKTILGAMVAPALLDRMLATKAWEGELDDEPDRPGRPDNLFQPVPGDWAAHGRFDDEAETKAYSFSEGSLRLAAVTLALGLAALSLGAAWISRKPEHAPTWPVRHTQRVSHGGFHRWPTRGKS